MKPATTLKKLEQKWDNTDKWLKRIISIVASLGAIAGMFTGILNLGLGKLDEHIDARVAAVSEQISTIEKQLDANTRATTRLELSMLIAHSPTNVLEIEKVARYYFIDLGGDWYMSAIYSEWAREYGGDLTFVTHKY